MFCHNIPKELNGLAKFNKEKIEEVCNFTIFRINQIQKIKRNRYISKIAKSLMQRSSGCHKYFPWNWGIKKITKEICLKYIDNFDVYHSIDYWFDTSVYASNKEKAQKILELCQKTKFNNIYLDGNDVNSLFWPKEIENA